MKILLLWDIDGTLITSGRSGMRALHATLQEVFGITGTLDAIPFAGRTDRWILREVFRHFDIPVTEENIQKTFARYVELLPAMLAQNREGRVLPGVHEILQAAAAHGHIAQGLLTGNLKRGAELKLVHYGLWQHFPFGAFADDSELRDELGPWAVRRAQEHHRAQFAPANVWIIGDTQHDIACGKVIGARTLAVATGGHTLDQLRQHEPTVVLENLADTAAVLKLLAG
ncbi:HAD family hydrolase [Opitutus sp. ER46]|uniref:HAD family hydrolase n=1 Tax=Opitutus sp. ER46 TaxID=2161864 RepID=UPI000D310A04|nr:HAD family hydrolase [Opitutus sp. ER46]PTX96681.1 hydrolase [Opitutus sp. ER46]